jgi:hypothetical protein
MTFEKVFKNCPTFIHLIGTQIVKFHYIISGKNSLHQKYFEIGYNIKGHKIKCNDGGLDYQKSLKLKLCHQILSTSSKNT